MPRRQGHIDKARNLQAFRMLTDERYNDIDHNVSKPPQKSDSKPASQRTNTSKVQQQPPSQGLLAGAIKEQSLQISQFEVHSSKYVRDLKTLQDLSQLDVEILKDIYIQAGRDVQEAATMIVNAIFSTNTPAVSSYLAPPRSASSATTNPPKPPQPAPTAATKQPLWSLLPAPVKEQIFSYLTTSELSQIAPVSQEFLYYALARRRNVSRIVIPHDASVDQIQGLISQHPYAKHVVFTKLAQTFKYPEIFDRVFEAAAKGAQGRNRQAELDTVEVCNCPCVTQTTVEFMQTWLEDIRCVDYSNCINLKDPALILLGQYHRVFHRASRNTHTPDVQHYLQPQQYRSVSLADLITPQKQRGKKAGKKKKNSVGVSAEGKSPLVPSLEVESTDRSRGLKGAIDLQLKREGVQVGNAESSDNNKVDNIKSGGMGDMDEIFDDEGEQYGEEPSVVTSAINGKEQYQTFGEDRLDEHVSDLDGGKEVGAQKTKVGGSVSTGKGLAVGKYGYSPAQFSDPTEFPMLPGQSHGESPGSVLGTSIGSSYASLLKPKAQNSSNNFNHSNNIVGSGRPSGYSYEEMVGGSADADSAELSTHRVEGSEPQVGEWDGSPVLRGSSASGGLSTAINQTPKIGFAGSSKGKEPGASSQSIGMLNTNTTESRSQSQAEEASDLRYSTEDSFQLPESSATFCQSSGDNYKGKARASGLGTVSEYRPSSSVYDGQSSVSLGVASSAPLRGNLSRTFQTQESITEAQSVTSGDPIDIDLVRGKSDSNLQFSQQLSGSYRWGGGVHGTSYSSTAWSLLGSSVEAETAWHRGQDAVKEHDDARSCSEYSEEYLGLEEVNISGCTSITDEGLKGFLQNSMIKKSLKILDVSGCTMLTDDALTLFHDTQIEVLRANLCKRLYHAQLVLPTNHPLQQLYLKDCIRLSSLRVHAPAAKLFHLVGNQRLATVRLYAPSLKRLLMQSCKQLRRFLPPCRLDSLLELNLYGCISISTSQVEALVAHAKCLRILDLQGCALLTKLRVNLGHLRKVDVSGCGALNQMDMSAPKLHILRAKGCGELQSLNFTSTHLHELDLTNCHRLARVTLPTNRNFGLPQNTDSKEAMPFDKQSGRQKLRLTDSDKSHFIAAGCTQMPSDLKNALKRYVEQY